MVRGRPFPLSRVRNDPDMTDLMTDQEYRGYVDLERQLERPGAPTTPAPPPAAGDPDAAGDPGPGPDGEPMVMVQGLPYPLSRVHYDLDLQDLMTDQEYLRFWDLEGSGDLLGVADPWADW